MESSNISCIYSIINLVNGKIYIGSAVNFRKRKNLHFRSLRLNKHHSITLQNAYNKYGKENFIIEITEYVNKREKLIEREQHWMNFFKPEYNIAKKAGSVLGIKMSDKVKEALRKANTGRVPWNKGKKFEDIFTQEDTIRIKTAMSPRGRKTSEETKRKLSEIRLGKKKSKNQRSIVVIDLLTNETLSFKSVSDCALHFNVKPQNISRVLTGKRPKLHKKYKIIYNNGYNS